MPDKLRIYQTDPLRNYSEYDWINVERFESRIGKIRADIDQSTLTIFSINIFPEFEGNGYARRIIELFKDSYNRIIADRVRFTAIGFWKKMGFSDAGGGNYVYEKNKSMNT